MKNNNLTISEKMAGYDRIIQQVEEVVDKIDGLNDSDWLKSIQAKTLMDDFTKGVWYIKSVKANMERLKSHLHLKTYGLKPFYHVKNGFIDVHIVEDIVVVNFHEYSAMTLTHKSHAFKISDIDNIPQKMEDLYPGRDILNEFKRNI